MKFIELLKDFDASDPIIVDDPDLSKLVFDLGCDKLASASRTIELLTPDHDSSSDSDFDEAEQVHQTDKAFSHPYQAIQQHQRQEKNGHDTAKRRHQWPPQICSSDGHIFVYKSETMKTVYYVCRNARTAAARKKGADRCKATLKYHIAKREFAPGKYPHTCSGCDLQDVKSENKKALLLHRAVEYVCRSNDEETLTPASLVRQIMAMEQEEHVKIFDGPADICTAERIAEHRLKSITRSLTTSRIEKKYRCMGKIF